MIAPQYKNIIQWTLKYEISDSEDDNMMIVRRIFSNLGVAFPLGDLDEIISVLKSKTYMGWRQCSLNDVQRYANAGVASIGIARTGIIVILPDEKIVNFSADKELVLIKKDFIKHTNELSCDEKNMMFFVYSYGFVFSD